MNAQELMRNDFLAVQAGDCVSDVLGKMRRGHTEAVIVDAKGKYLGMFDKRALLKSRVDPCGMKVQRWLIGKVPQLSRDTPFREIVRLMHASDTHVLPVTDGIGRVEGVVGARHALAEHAELFKGMKASDVASRKVTCLNENDSLGRLVNVLRESRISRVPVVDEAGKLAGIATLVDLLSKYLILPSHAETRAERGRPSGGGSRGGRKDKVDQNSLPVSNVMTRTVQTATLSAALSTVIDIMHRNHISDVVLVEKDIPVGIVTTKDLLGVLVAR